MISKSTFFNRYNKNSKYNPSRTKGPFMARWLLRDLSFPIAYYFAEKNVSANQITGLIIFIYLLANFVLVFPTVWAMVAFVLLYIVSDIFDCVDGQLARYYGTSSEYGRILDDFVHTFSACTFIMGLCLHFYLRYQGVFVIILGLFGVLSFVFDVKWLELSGDIFSRFTKDKNDNNDTSLFNVKRILKLADNFTYVVVFFLGVNSLEEITNKSYLSLFFFALYILFLVISKLIFRFYVLFKFTNSLPKNVWKGWL